MDSDVAESKKEIKSLEKKSEEDADTRSADHQDFTIKLNDMNGAINEVTEAIEVMRGGMGTNAISLMQVPAATEKVRNVLGMAVEHDMLRPKNQKQADAIAAFLEVDPAAAKMAAASGSKFHSAEIIETLMETLKTFKIRKNKLEQKESETNHAFEMKQGSRFNQLSAYQDQVARTEEIIAGMEKDKSQSEKEKEDTTVDKDSDQTFLDTLVKTCEDTANAWDTRSKTRSNELSAIAEALEILKGKISESYGANSQLNFLQTSSKAADEPSRKAFELLSERADALNSPTLSTLVLKMQADHFKKVRDMIKDLVAKLEADAEAEQTQKGWCDDEMEKATSKRDENIGALEGDIAAITETQAKIDTLAEEVSNLEKEIASLYNALNEATDLRKADKSDNAKTVTDATAGLNAVKAAIKVLKDFYENALIQTGSSYKPPKGDADGNTVGDLAPKMGFGNEDEFKGNQDASTGIIGMMDVIQSDFEGTIEATNDAEKDAEKEFTDFKKETDDTLKEKKDLVNKKQGSKKTEKANLVDYKDDLKDHGDLKKEALDELSKLKPTCVGTGMDYKERVARREQEIESLKSAYLVFDDMALVQVQKH